MSELREITPKPGLPLYEVVKDAVRDAIDKGRFKAGERLPSTKALSEEMSVSLVTVHRAMQELVSSGVLKRGQGRGTYVHEDYGRDGLRGHGMRFGLVFHIESSLADSYHGQILEGVRKRADELGIDLVLLRFGEDWRNECQGYLYVNPFSDQMAKSPRGARKVRGVKDPIIVVGASFDAPGVLSVDTDNVGIGRMAVKHLMVLGHRRIAFVGGAGTVSNDRDRYQGYIEASAESGLLPSPRHIVRCGGWRADEAGMNELVRALTAKDRPTAVFAAGYYFALDVFAAAAKAGLRIPDDLSVVGVDDPPSAVHLSPPLTTFRQPLTQMGRFAVDQLFNVINGHEARATAVTLAADFVERSSTTVTRYGAASRLPT